VTVPFYLLEYTLAGLLVGTSIGLTGIGGSSMMAPLLILVFHVPAARAVQLDFLYLTPTKLVGAWQHYRHGTIDPTLTTVLAVGAIPGTVAVSLFVARVVAANPELDLSLRHVIGFFVLASALLILAQLAVMWHKQFWKSGHRRVKLTRLAQVLVALVGLGVGVLVGATSIGAGSILLPLLVMLLRIRMRELVSTGIVLGALMAIIGAAVHSLAREVSWELVAALLLGSVPGALLGAKLVGIVSTRLVRCFVSGALVIAGLGLIGALTSA